MKKWILLTLILSGCKLGPEFETPPMDEPMKFENAQTQVGSFDSEIAWWKRFNDPILNDLIQQTVTANNELKAAVSNIQGARAGVSGSVAGLFPQINGDASATKNRTSINSIAVGTGKPFNHFQTGFTAVWEVDLFGRVLSAIDAAEANLDLSVNEARGLMITLLADVAQTYINLRGYQKQLEATKTNADLWDNIYKMTDDLNKAGLIATEIDVLQAKTNRDDALANVPSLEANIKSSMHHLATLTGQNPTALYDRLKVHKPVPEMDEAIFAGLPSELLKRRPDILAAEASFAAANAEVGVAVGNLFPSLSLTGNYGWNSQKKGNLFTHSSSAYSYGPSLLWTIIDFGRLSSALDSATAVRNAQFFAYKSTVLKAFEEVESTLVNYAKERERYMALKQALDASKNAAKLSLTRYQAGKISFIQTVQTEISYQLNTVAYIQSLVTRSTNAIAIYKALGGGWQPFDGNLIKASEEKVVLEK